MSVHRESGGLDCCKETFYIYTAEPINESFGFQGFIAKDATISLRQAVNSTAFTGYIQNITKRRVRWDAAEFSYESRNYLNHQ